MRVTRLPVDTGISGWQGILPESEKAVSLNALIEADVLVIGAGFAGLAAARRASQLSGSARIVILEAKRIGEGPAGRNSGFMIDLPHEIASSDYASSLERDRKQISLNRHAISFARDAVREFDMPPEVFDECGKVNGAAAQKAIRHNLDYAKHLDVLGEEYSMLNAAQMRELTGSDFYQSGLYTPGTVLIQPVLFVRGMATGLANRASIFENSPVTALSRSNSKWTAETPGGAVIFSIWPT